MATRTLFAPLFDALQLQLRHDVADFDRALRRAALRRRLRLVSARAGVFGFALGLLAAMVSTGCDGETIDDPESECAAWLRCYEECDPFEYAADGDPDFARASVRFCAEECGDGGRSSTPTAIAVLDEQLADARATAEERIEAGVAAMRARSTCRVEELEAAQ